MLISITGAHAKAKANAAQGLLEFIEIVAGKKFLLVILLYFSKHFYVIMKTELSQEKIVREKIYGHTIYKTIINNR